MGENSTTTSTLYYGVLYKYTPGTFILPFLLAFLLYFSLYIPLFRTVTHRLRKKTLATQYSNFFK